MQYEYILRSQYTCTVYTYMMLAQAKWQRVNKRSREKNANEQDIRCSPLFSLLLFWFAHSLPLSFSATLSFHFIPFFPLAFTYFRFVRSCFFFYFRLLLLLLLFYFLHSFGFGAHFFIASNLFRKVWCSLRAAFTITIFCTCICIFGIRYWWWNDGGEDGNSRNSNRSHCCKMELWLLLFAFILIEIQFLILPRPGEFLGAQILLHNFVMEYMYRACRQKGRNQFQSYSCSLWYLHF